MITDDTHGVVIQEGYKDFTPPVWVNKTVTRLISRTPFKYLTGLETVILSNTDGFNRSQRRQKTLWRKRKVLIRECRGLYFQKWQGQSATIQLFVDNIVQSWPALVLRWTLFRDLLFADVLYHEIGHHIHKAIAPEHKEREDVADHWGKKLTRLYMRRKYWYLMPLVFVLRTLLHRKSKSDRRYSEESMN